MMTMTTASVEAREEPVVQTVRCSRCGKIMVAQRFCGNVIHKCFLCKMIYPEPEERAAEPAYGEL